MNIFVVQSDFEKYNIEVPSLSAGAKKLDIPHAGDNLYVRVFNEDHKIFIREGLNMNAGTPTADCFCVDKEGNIYPSVDWDYPQVTKAYAKCTDDTPITIKGGIFTTIANREESFYRYHSRGISVARSHVTIEGITHYVTGELDHGAPYGGFIRSSEVINLTVRDCLLTPHFIYRTPSKIPGKMVSMGSYDINFSASIDVKCINITQTVDIMDKRYWGIYTSNFCKNLYLENCTLSRFDAHQGVTNVTIKGCKLGHQCLNLIGFGEALIEDTFAYGAAFVALRADYGSIWRGNITIRNCVWKPGSDTLSIIRANYSGKHDFGYQCSMPTEVMIDGLEILDSDYPQSQPHVLPNYNSNYSDENPYVYKTTSHLVMKNLKTQSGKTCVATLTPHLYKNLTVE